MHEIEEIVLDLRAEYDGRFERLERLAGERLDLITELQLAVLDLREQVDTLETRAAQGDVFMTTFGSLCGAMAAEVSRLTGE